VQTQKCINLTNNNNNKYIFEKTKMAKDKKKAERQRKICKEKKKKLRRLTAHWEHSKIDAPESH
jgi:hypothetical protein